MWDSLAKKIDAEIAKSIFKALTYNAGANSAANGGLVGNLIDITGAGSYDISKAGIAELIQAVHINDSALEDWTLVLNPKCYASLFKLDDFARYDVIGSSMEAPRVSGYVGKLGGVDVVVSNNFRNKDNSAYLTEPVFNKADGTTDESDDLAGFLIRKDAIKIAYASGMRARVQTDYSLTSLSTQIVADSVYGCKIIGDNSSNKSVFALCDA